MRKYVLRNTEQFRTRLDFAVLCIYDYVKAVSFWFILLP